MLQKGNNNPIFQLETYVTDFCCFLVCGLHGFGLNTMHYENQNGGFKCNKQCCWTFNTNTLLSIVITGDGWKRMKSFKICNFFYKE